MRCQGVGAGLRLVGMVGWAYWIESCFGLTCRRMSRSFEKVQTDGLRKSDGGFPWGFPVIFPVGTLQEIRK